MSERTLSERGEALRSVIFTVLDKPERVAALWACRFAVEPTDAAILFRDVWTNSESLFLHGETLGQMIHFLHEQGVIGHTMDDDERSLLALHKDRATMQVFRGAANHNVNGYSWTTSEEVARQFAERNALDGKPLLVTARFNISDVVAFFDTGEQEVVVDIRTPTAEFALERARIVKLPEIEVSPGKIMAYRVQAFGNHHALGAEFADERAKTELKMRATMARLQGLTWEKIEASFLKDIAKVEVFAELEDISSRKRRELRLFKEAFDAADPELSDKLDAVEAKVG